MALGHGLDLTKVNELKSHARILVTKILFYCNIVLFSKSKLRTSACIPIELMCLSLNSNYFTFRP